MRRRGALEIEMKRKTLLILSSILLIVTVSIALTTGVSAEPADHSSFGIYWIWEPPFSPDPVGTVSVIRRDNGITGNVSTSLANDGTGNYHGGVVTLWIAIYNEPENCYTTPCGKADAFTNPAAVPDIVYGGGRVVGGSEKVNISFSLNEGDNSGSIFGEGSPGLIDASKAEFEYVLRSKGPNQPGNTNDMLKSVMGGCFVDDDHPPLPGYPDPVDENDLHTELGDCQDIQLAHLLAP
jgi:hypothetical protein